MSVNLLANLCSCSPTKVWILNMTHQFNSLRLSLQVSFLLSGLVLLCCSKSDSLISIQMVFLSLCLESARLTSSPQPRWRKKKKKLFCSVVQWWSAESIKTQSNCSLLYRVIRIIGSIIQRSYRKVMKAACSPHTLCAWCHMHARTRSGVKLKKPDMVITEGEG